MPERTLLRNKVDKKGKKKNKNKLNWEQKLGKR